MLKFLRDKRVKKKIFIGIGIFVIPSFLIWAAVIDRSGSDTGPVAGTVGGRKIATGGFLRHLQSLRRELYLLHGPKGEELLKTVDMERAVWDRILLLEEARRRKLRVSNAEVIDWISRQSIFQPSGYFEPAVYKRFVEYQLRIQPRDFEEDIRQFLTLRKVVEALSPETQFTEEDARRVFREQSAPRDLRYTLVADSAGAEAKPMAEEEIKQIYDIVKDNLTTPEKLKLSYVVLEKGSPSDTPETRKELEMGGLEKAAGPGLEVRTASVSREDPLPEVGFSKTLSDSLGGLQAAGDRTGWIETDKGAVMARLDAREESRKLEYEEARVEIEKRLMESRRQEAVRDRAVKIRAAMAEKGFETVAAEEKLEILEAKGHKPGDYLDKAGVISDFGRALGGVGAGSLSDPVPFAGGFLIVRVDSIDENYGEGWDAAKARILEELVESARGEALSSKLKELWATLKPNYKTMGAVFPEKYASGFAPLTQSSAPELSSDTKK